jgi:hypothetical protein
MRLCLDQESILLPELANQKRQVEQPQKGKKRDNVDEKIQLKSLNLKHLNLMIYFTIYHSSQ